MKKLIEFVKINHMILLAMLTPITVIIATIIIYFSSSNVINMNHQEINTYKNQSQWQATLIFPDKIRGITVEKFSTEYQHSYFGFNGWLPSFDEINNKCLWWTGVYQNKDKIHINCFIQKVEYEKEPNVKN